MNELEGEMSFANDETESLKEKLRKWRRCLVNSEMKRHLWRSTSDVKTCGFSESKRLQPGTLRKTVLLEFLKNELCMDIADSFEFQRVHRNWKA